jgi:hypothetical protein
MNKQLERHYQIARKEIGEIKPWWSDEDEMYVFEHEAYPVVCYANPEPEVVIKRYKQVLKDFIKDRLAGNVAESVERITPGRGGSRLGASRAKGSTKNKTKRITLPNDVATWLTEDPSRIEKVRALMAH